MQDKKPHPKYCHCGKRMVCDHIAIGPAGTIWEDEFVSYCGRCEFMSHVPQFFVIRRDILMKRTPYRATALLSIRSRPDGMAEVDYAVGSGQHAVILTAHPYDRRSELMGINPNDILLLTWKRIDLYTEMVISAGGPPTDLAVAKGKARAYAEVLADMMPPFFTTPDEIVREAVNRYNNRDNPEYETPGLGIESLAAFDMRPAVQKRSTPTGPKSTGNQIPDTAVATNKAAIESNMFTVNQVAAIYKMNPDEVKSQLGLV